MPMILTARSSKILQNIYEKFIPLVIKKAYLAKGMKPFSLTHLSLIEQCLRLVGVEMILKGGK